MPEGARAWIGFIAMCLAMFMAILDIQVVASSLTNIGEALAVPTDRLSWIQTSYLMAEIISIPLTGWLTRALSLRWMFAIATAGFTIASFACAMSGGIDTLIGIRIIQGFFGGMLIPAVFTSVFTHLPEKDRVVATTIGGVFAVIAPTIGPAVGGYLTETFSWHAIFLVNVIPGIIVCALVVTCVRKDPLDLGAFRHIDYAGIALACVFLASLEVLLKEAPKHDWQGRLVFVLGPICSIAAALAAWRMFAAAHPFVRLSRFKRTPFAVGCILSLTFGAGLYGSVYALAIFLGLVRGHLPLAIGIVMLVSGAAQLLTAPFAAILETRVAPRLLVAFGFGLFAIGLYANGFSTKTWDFNELFWPQVLRGVAVMFCLLSATRIALDIWPEEEVAEASALFNLMRNLGGALCIALVDTILFQQTPHHVANIVASLQTGDVATAKEVGLPVQRFLHHIGPLTFTERAIVRPMVEKAALARSFNDAWFVMAAIMAASLLLLPLVGRGVRRGTPAPH